MHLGLNFEIWKGWKGSCKLGRCQLGAYQIRVRVEDLGHVVLQQPALFELQALALELLVNSLSLSIDSTTS